MQTCLNGPPDCELLGHPNISGEGCPCGLVVLEPVAPQPYPVPVDYHAEVSLMLWAIVDDERNRRIASWWATMAPRLGR